MSPAATAPGAVDSGAVDSGAGTDRRLWSHLHLGTLLVAAVVLLTANRGQWFFKDDFEFLTRRTGQPNGGSVWEPHNAHWSTLPVLAYRALFAVFHMTTYWPWILLVVLVHLTTVHLVWRLLLRVQAGPVVATATAAVLAVLGSGAENLLWGFQIGFIGAVTGVLGATLLLDRERLGPGRLIVVWALLVAALMCSGISIPVMVLPGVVSLARHRVVRTAAVFTVPVAVYATWYRTAGGGSTAAPRPTVSQYLHYVGAGLVDAVSAVGGSRLAPFVLALAVVVAAVLVARHRELIDRPAAVLVLGSGLAVLAQYASIAVGRATLGVGQAGESRYVYVAAVTGAPLVAGLVGVLLRRRPRLATVPLATLVFWALAHNCLALQARASFEQEREQAGRSDIAATLVLVRHREPVLDVSAYPGSGYAGTSAIAYLDARGDFGDTLRGAAPDVLAAQRLRVQFEVAQGDAPLTDGPLRVRPAPGTNAVAAGGCTAFRLDGGGRAQVVLDASRGPGAVTVRAPHSGAMTAEYLIRSGEPVASATVTEVVYAGKPTTLTWVGRVGTVRLSFPGGGATSVCQPGRSPTG